MQPFCGWHRVPRAGEPLVTPDDAIAVVKMAMHQPLRDETIAVLMDAESCAGTIVVVSGTTEPDSVVTVVELLAAVVADSHPGSGLLIASVRPGDPLAPGDVDRWLDASAAAEDVGAELVEWFVVSGTAEAPAFECPRDRLGERPRW